MARGLKERKEAAIEAVVRQFLDSSHAAVEVVTAAVAGKAARGATVKAPRLRFDRVVREMLGHLHETLHADVPRGLTVGVTVTAPIRVSGKTTAELEERIRALLGKRSARRSLKAVVHGNEVQVRVMKTASQSSTSRLVGFVHNRDSDPGVLFDLVGALLRSVATVKRRRRKKGSGERWLVVAIDDQPALLGTYRHVCDQVFAGSEFARVILVDGEGRVVA